MHTKRVVIQDEYGTFAYRMPLADALVAVSRGELYFASGRNVASPKFRKVGNPLLESKESATQLECADVYALERLADQKKIDQKRWERLVGYGFDPDPTLMQTA